MEIITRQNLSEIKTIYFHDAEISRIICDYIEHTVRMPIKLYKRDGMKEAEITFENIVNVDISLAEPWGAGMYVNGVAAESIEVRTGFNAVLNSTDYFKVCFELNSGDNINIVTSKMVLERT